MVTLGEALIVMDPVERGPLRHVPGFRKRVGGAELNVAVALARLGHRVGWAGSLGDDEFGREVLGFLRAEGVDVSGAVLDPGAPTGLYFKEWRAGGLRAHYYRSGSAASRMGPGSVDEEQLLSGRVLHLTGITPALSGGCRELVGRLAGEAGRRGVLLSFDANIRWRLFGERDPREVIGHLLRRAGLLFLSDEEAELLLGGNEPPAVERARERLGAGVVVVHSAGGSFAVDGGGITRREGYAVEAVDTVGAGDAFVAGFLSGFLRGWEVGACLELANACGACAVAVPGDAASMPSEEEALALIRGRRERER